MCIGEETTPYYDPSYDLLSLGYPRTSAIINHKFLEMPIAFKKFERDTTEVNELGTVKSLAGKGGSVSFLRKNFKDKSKSVALILERKDKTSAVIPLSKPLSQMVRDEEITMKQLVGLTVIEFPHRDKVDAKGKPVLVHCVALPQGGGKQTFALDELQEETLELSDEFLPESLVVLT